MAADVVLELRYNLHPRHYCNEVIAQAQPLTRRRLGDSPEARVDAFLAEQSIESRVGTRWTLGSRRRVTEQWMWRASFLQRL
jgi:hypothetical protein